MHFPSWILNQWEKQSNQKRIFINSSPHLFTYQYLCPCTLLFLYLPSQILCTLYLRLTHFHLSVGSHSPWGPYNSPFSPVPANLFLLFSPSGYKHLFFSVKKRMLSLKVNSDYLWVVRMLLICIFFTFWNFSYCQIFYNDYIICIIRKTQMS